MNHKITIYNLLYTPHQTQPLEVDIRFAYDRYKYSLPKSLLNLLNAPKYPTEYYLPKDQKNWINIFRLIVYIISGQIIGEKSLNLILTAIYSLPKTIKNKLTPRFVFGSIAYLSIGFGLKIRGPSQNDSNNIRDFNEIINKLIDNINLNLIIPLCVHREANAVAKNKLVEQVKTGSIIRNASLLKGIFDNSPISSVRVAFFQPTCSAKTGTMVFPDIYLEYLKERKLHIFFKTLHKHFVTTKKTFTSCSNRKTEFTVKPMDEYVKQVEKVANSLFGFSWMQIEEWGQITKKKQLMQDIIDIAENVTKPEIVRLIPTYLNNLDISDYKHYLQQNLQQKKSAVYQKIIIDSFFWFFEKGRLNLTSKALYETLFYYVWGSIARKENQIGIGLERDHALFQVLSWKLGYCRSFDDSFAVPLIYARRTKDERIDADLNHISFRQFWRTSGK